LRALQDSWNVALGNARHDIPSHVDTKPFHLDFVEADRETATAFCYGGFALIAVSAPLLFSLSDVCMKLSKSPEIATVLGIPFVPDDYNQFHAVLLSILSAFVVAHEYTHHVYGHVSEDDWLSPFLHISACSGGSLAQQTDEVIADGYAIYHVLENNVVTTTANGPNPFFALNSDGSTVSDQQMVAMVAVVVAAYMFTLHECPLSLLTAYTLSHPPPPVRLELVMTEAFLWAREFPALGKFLQKNFLSLASVAAPVIVGQNKAKEMWGQQKPFLQSAVGKAYTQALIDSANKFKASRP
jgi:hypothetical protein